MFSFIHLSQKAFFAIQLPIVAVKSLAQAEEAHRLASLRFKEGISTSLEVIDTEVALTGAETALVTAVYDHRIAQADLERATAERSSWPGAARKALAEYSYASTPNTQGE